MFKIKDFDKDQLDALLDAAAYAEVVKEEGSQ
jgi:hypothetical protein